MNVTIKSNNRNIDTVITFFENLAEFENVDGEITERQTIYTAETDNNEIIGAVAIDPEGYITRIGVQSTHRQEGIGKQLLDHIEQSEKIEMIQLVCSTENTIGQKFFENNGFSGEKEYELIHYEKEL